VDTEGVMRMTKVAFWCIQDNPNQRPWMSVALKMLEGEWDVPDAPMWLLQRGPEFLEGYGYEPIRIEMEITKNRTRRPLGWEQHGYWRIR
jgi:hypothetical protein